MGGNLPLEVGAVVHKIFMHAVVSLLDDAHAPQMEALWQALQADCGLAGITLTPLPHLSWHIAAEYSYKRLETALQELTAAAAPFTLRTTGLAVFTGPSPVVFIPVVKTPALSAFHKVIWEKVQPLAIAPSLHYAPDAWVPHITLAYGDVTPENLGCAMEMLAFRSFDWEIQIDHLALVYQLSGQVGRMQNKYAFGTQTNEAAA